MDEDPTTTARLALKRPHEAHSGDTPAPKRVQISLEPTSDQDSEDEIQCSPTVNTKKRKTTPASTTTRKTQPKGNPCPPQPPQFPTYTPPEAPTPLLNIPLPPAFETLPATSPSNLLLSTQPPETVTHHNSVDEDDTRTSLEDLYNEWEEDPLTEKSDMKKFFSKGPETQMIAHAPSQQPAKKEWLLVQGGTDNPTLEHRSDNPFDFLTAAKLNALIRFWEEEDVATSELTSLERRALRQPGIKKILAKVAYHRPNTMINDTKNAWIRAAILSAVAQKGGETKEFANSLTMIDPAKPGYSWVIIPVKATIFKALASLRAAIDPRSGTLVLLRPWREVSAPIQHMYAFGIHRPDDTIPFNTAATDYKEQMSNALAENHVKILEMTPTQYGDIGTYCTVIKFGFTEEAAPFIISPHQLTCKFWTGVKNKKTACNVEYKWPPKCHLCESESHTTPHCPWPKIEVEGRKPNFNNCCSHLPGWTEPQRKTKGTTTVTSTIVSDMRPKHMRPTVSGMDAGKGKGKAVDCDDIAFFLYFYSYYSYSAPFRSVPLHSAPLPIPDSPISPIAVAHRALQLRRA